MKNHEEDESALPAPRPETAAGVLLAAARASDRGVDGAMATVLERHGSAPGTPGQKLYLAADGECVGTVGGGAVERAVLETLAAMCEGMARPKARSSGGADGCGDGRGKVTHTVRTFKLGAELGMCCGGRLEVLVEPILGTVPCFLIGGGHVATAVAPLLARVGFSVTVVDSRPEWGADGRLDGVTSVLGDFDDAGKAIDARGACIVMTHDHQLDQRAIEWALRKGFSYVGGVGSRAKAERTRQRLEAKGFTVEDCARVRMPVGVDIGARLPEEIAVAIAAELVNWRKRGTAA